MRLRSISISCLVITGDHATISGIGEMNGSPVNVRVDVDQGRGADVGFSLQLSNGYNRNGVFRNGHVEVESCTQAHAQINGTVAEPLAYAHARHQFFTYKDGSYDFHYYYDVEQKPPPRRKKA